MENTALDIVMDRIKAVLAGIQVGDPLAALFKAGFEEGDEVDETDLPIFALVYDPESVTELTQKIKQTMPFTVEWMYDVPEGSTPRKRGTYIFGEIKKALLANRTLPGAGPTAAAIDLRYVGGGNSYEPLGGDNPAAKWGGAADFEVDYRHSTADPTVVG